MAWLPRWLQSNRRVLGQRGSVAAAGVCLLSLSLLFDIIRCGVCLL